MFFHSHVVYNLDVNICILNRILIHLSKQENVPCISWRGANRLFTNDFEREADHMLPTWKEEIDQSKAHDWKIDEKLINNGKRE